MQDCKWRIAALQAAICSPQGLCHRPLLTSVLLNGSHSSSGMMHEKLDLLDFVTILLSTEHDEISPREVFVVPG